MENASKALIMAGGMLLAILIIALLLYAWSLFSKYQSSKDELQDIENTAKFNEQFANYDRKGVQGYELLSLVNKVIDYNYRKSNLSEAKNDEKYKPIKITINMKTESIRKRTLTVDGNNLRLFKLNQYIQSDVANTFKSIIDICTEIENRYGGADCATKMAKSISSIYLTDEQIAQNQNMGKSVDDSWKEAIKKFNSISLNLTVENKSQLITQQDDVYKYYEYVQFKRSKFNSDTSAIKYDASTGRICEMKFDFTGELY